MPGTQGSARGDTHSLDGLCEFGGARAVSVCPQLQLHAAVHTLSNSSLIQLRSEAAQSSQTGLLELARVSEREGALLADPGSAVLLRATARSSDDWLIA